MARKPPQSITAASISFNDETHILVAGPLPTGAMLVAAQTLLNADTNGDVLAVYGLSSTSAQDAAALAASTMLITNSALRLAGQPAMRIRIRSNTQSGWNIPLGIVLGSGPRWLICGINNTNAAAAFEYSLTAIMGDPELLVSPTPGLLFSGPSTPGGTPGSAPPSPPIGP